MAHGSQSATDCEPLRELDVPAPHGVQTLRPLTFEKEPAAQGVQAASDTDLTKGLLVPGLQGVH